jgi:hypothetical protein
VLRRTQEAASALRLAVELLPVWYDVDVPADLQRLRHPTATGDPVANHTRAWLEAAPPAVRAASENESRYD